MTDRLCEAICAGEKIRENLIELNKLIKDKDYFDLFLDSYYKYEDVFIRLLDHDDPKVRKNVIKILGRVGDSPLLSLLFEHYQAEQTQYLKSEYLMALESFDYSVYLPELKSRWAALENEERTKHSTEEIHQLRKLIWSAEPPKHHTFIGEGLENKLLLIVPKGHEAAVLEKIQAIEDTTGKKIPGGCFVTTKHLDEVKKIRLFQALLFDFYPVTIHSDNGKEIGTAILKAGIVKYIRERHAEKPPFIFRVEVKGVKDVAKKNKLAKDVSLYLEENSRGMLINEPSFYAVEIRIIVGSKGSRVFLKLKCLADERFNYRKYATATSMHPAKAALMLHYARPYLKENANVLDPFCGTGTLLIERTFINSCKSLYGLDISAQSIQAASENGRRAMAKLHIIQRNFNDFKHSYLFDEILTDMPRIAGAKQPRQAEHPYQLLFARAREFLVPDGIMAVYSEDEAVMDRKISENDGFMLLEKIAMTKDRTAWVYILKNKKQAGEMK